MLVDKTSEVELSRTPHCEERGQVIYMTAEGEDWCRNTAPIYMRSHEDVSTWARSEHQRHAARNLGWLVTAFRVEWF